LPAQGDADGTLATIRTSNLRSPIAFLIDEM